MAKGIEVPVVSVVDQLLWRDLPLGLFVRAFVEMTDLQASSHQERIGYGAEDLLVDGAPGQRKHPNPRREFVRIDATRFEHLLQSLFQRIDLVGKYRVGLECREQLRHAQKRQDLPVAQPKAGKGVRGGVLAGSLESVSVEFPVPDDRRTEAVSEVFQIPPECRSRNLKGRKKGPDRYGFARRQKRLDLVETLGSVHLYSN